jgi:PPIC-type PPIASE domain
MPKSLLREPLVHFLALGALLFALHAWLKPSEPAASTTEIVVDEARILSLAQNFRRTWQRGPTPEELQGLIESHVREEVMVREALALGLDRDDAIVRRRLQQKMDFLIEEAALATPASDAELQAFLQANADKFRSEPQFSFEQVYLDPARRGQRLADDAARLRTSLQDGRTTPAQAGDRLQLLQTRYLQLPQGEIARLFGEDFARALPALAIGEWAGPVSSGYGAHLVRVEAFSPGAVPPLAEVRAQVEREWAHARRQASARGAYAALRAKYLVRVGPAGAASAPGGKSP